MALDIFGTDIVLNGSYAESFTNNTASFGSFLVTSVGSGGRHRADD
ncbi:MAG TPA: hypothetical protein VL093_00630 [Flavipsychrobacter sp.]|nr:hypothetical protein [Flavipsychrobacter sp.]